MSGTEYSLPSTFIKSQFVHHLHPCALLSPDVLVLKPHSLIFWTSSLCQYLIINQAIHEDVDYQHIFHYEPRV